MKHSLRQGAGYLQIDHTNSPGLTPADVACLPGTVAVGAGEVYERDTLQCTHCQRMIKLHPLRTRDRGYCPKCDHYICDPCEEIRKNSGACVPMAKVFDRVQAHAEKFAGQPDHPEADVRVVLTDAWKEQI